MADALTVPHAVTAIVLCVAGIAKLRSPGTAAAAVGAPTAPVRAFAIYELALGVAALVWPAASPLLALTYLGLAGLTFVLARRAGACGCFGEGDAPASGAQALLSLILAIVAAVPTHGAAWVLGRSIPVVCVLVLGIVAAAYATVVAYVEMPMAWRAWGA